MSTFNLVLELAGAISLLYAFYHFDKYYRGQKARAVQTYRR